MALNEATFRTVAELTELIGNENDIGQLRELVLAINTLLDAIEKQRIKLEGLNSHTQ